MEQYFHLFANGNDVGNFIISEKDFEAAFNRVALCAFRHSKVKVLGFSIEESHPHFLLKGDYDECVAFKCDYESITSHYIVSSRGCLDEVFFELEINAIKDSDHLINTASYVIVQATKDGKRIMPYDYRWGTASMYFRPEGYPELWMFDSDWNLCSKQKFGELHYAEKRRITHSHRFIPDDWLVCNGIILPSNYLYVDEFESIFGSFNRFRTFLSAGKNRLQVVVDAMIMTRGVNMDDSEARKISGQISERMFGKRDSRWLSPTQRLKLATVLRHEYRISMRQVSTLCRLPESEIRKYLE